VDSIRAFAEELPGMFSTGDNEPLPCNTSTTSITERRATTNVLALFPNPVQDLLSLHTDALPAGASILIHDAVGQLVAQFSTKGDLTRMDVSALRAGLYTVRIVTSGTRSAGRFIKE
jgi:hypothetical protein